MEIELDTVAELILRNYGIKGNLKPLPGEADLNYYVLSEDGPEYTLKISPPDTEEEELEFQQAILQHLSDQQFDMMIPELIPTHSGSYYFTCEEDDFKNRLVRLQKWVSGRMLANANPRSASIFQSWGQCIGQLSKALSNFDHPYAHRFYLWDPSECLFTRKFRHYISDPEQLEIADYFWNLFERDTKGKLEGLRKSVNYNDAHEHNLIIDGELQNPQIIGVIDFGDALYTQTINELAIACAYACMSRLDPLETLMEMVKAYNEVFPLKEDEAELLFPLITGRLLITIGHAAKNRIHQPENAYLFISEETAWKSLKKWRTISPRLVHYAVRHACGWEACKQNAYFKNWQKNHSSTILPPIDTDDQITTIIDLSVGSKVLGNNDNFSTSAKFKRTIANMLDSAGAEIGFGGYGEFRPVYTTDAFRSSGNNGERWRTMHLGIDVWCAEGTSIRAPIDGTVWSLQNNKAKGDYGPTIILQHQVDELLCFYSLYGHVDIQSIHELSVGMPVEAGQIIARVGTASVNGDWPPHLHFQLILDLLDKTGDFIGVCFPNESEIWKSICPDPSSFFDTKVQSDKGNRKELILATRKKILGRSLSISYDQPLHIVRGYMQHLFDFKGQAYLDTVNNVAHVGHEHPQVIEAAQRQMNLLNTNTRYLHEEIVLFAEELVARLPAPLSVVHFVNSGSEANELAMRMVESYTGQKDMIAMDVGYHGNTAACIDVSAYKFNGKGGKGKPEYTEIVPMPDVYRGPYKNPENAGIQYAAHILEAIERINSKDRNVGAFIGESIMSCGGQIVLPQGYLKEIYKTVRAAGGLCIADEVQVGFGRVGNHFWGFELQDVIPDIVTMGKPIGNGHPLAAVVTTSEVADTFANGMEYFNTFGGNPVSCAIGRKVLQIMADDDLQKRALTTGNFLKHALHKLQQHHPIIGDVRGHGLFLGIELVLDKLTLEPAPLQTEHLSNRMKEQGILMSTDGPYYNVLKIKPPMCFNLSDAEKLLVLLDKTLNEDFFKV